MLGLGLNMNSTSAQDSGVNRVAPYSNEYGITLDGVGDVVTLGLDDNQMDTLFNGDFSVSFWVKDSAWSTSYLFGFNTTSNSFWVRMLNVGALYWQTACTHNSDAGSGGLAAAGSLSTSDYIHVLVSVTAGVGANRGTLKLYADGVQKISTSTATGTNHAAADIGSGIRFAVGARNTAKNVYDGHASSDFDEVAIWDTALSAAEATAIYNSGESFDLQSDNGDYTSSADLQYYFRFENDLTDTMGNSSADANAVGDATFNQPANLP